MVKPRSRSKNLDDAASSTVRRSSRSCSVTKRQVTPGNKVSPADLNRSRHRVNQKSRKTEKSKKVAAGKKRKSNNALSGKRAKRRRSSEKEEESIDESSSDKRVEDISESVESDEDPVDLDANGDVEEGGFLLECQKEFDSSDLYAILGIKKDASDGEIRKAFRLVALKFHPDKHPDVDQESMNKKFQIVNCVYKLLSDKSKRAFYDRTGSVSKDDFNDIDWAHLQSRVTLEEMKDFMDSYVGSEEEKKDLLENYAKWKGDWDNIYQHQVGHNAASEPRLKQIVRDAIESGEVDDLGEEPASKAKARMKMMKKEEKEAEEQLKKMRKGKEGNGLTDLAKQIALNQKSRAQDLSQRLQRYVDDEENDDNNDDDE